MGATILDIVYLVVMILGITFGGIILLKFIIDTCNTEHRKNAEQSIEILDKYLSKISDTIVKTYKEVFDKPEEKKML